MATEPGFLASLPDISAGNYIALASVVTVGFGIALLRQLVSGGVCHSKARLDGKFVIVTGANTGIGKETAKDLAVRGARVMIACRDPLKGAAAADDVFKSTGQRLAVKTLDLANLDSVRQFAESVIEDEPRLDILINNAGVMMCPKLLSKQGYELQFATNHLGHFLLTNLLLPAIQKSASGRIVVVSSGSYKPGKIHFEDINSDRDYNRFAAYAQSKLANILFSNELAKRLKGTGVTVNCLHPGVIDTDLLRHLLGSLPGVIKLVIKPLLFLVKYLAFKTVTQGAQTSIYCAVSEEVEGVTGIYYSDCAETKLLPKAKDEDAARRLWELSEEMVGLKTRADNPGQCKTESFNNEDKDDDEMKCDAGKESDSEENTEPLAESGSKQTTV